jgi:protein-S-isoprenylcysteine O-methyltransferase Ste14
MERMFDLTILIITLLLLLVLIFIIAHAIIRKQKIIGRPPIPVFYFILAKIFVITNLVFLLMRSLKIQVFRLFDPFPYIEAIALFLLILGSMILIISAVQLKTDLIFGLSDSGDHKLQTKGIYALSRHPFYLGFIFILFSSCLFTPNYLNILAFSGAWLIHHFIMIREEQSLALQYGEEYRQYVKKVRRYITFKIS